MGQESFHNMNFVCTKYFFRDHRKFAQHLFTCFARPVRFVGKKVFQSLCLPFSTFFLFLFLLTCLALLANGVSMSILVCLTYKRIYTYILHIIFQSKCSLKL